MIRTDETIYIVTWNGYSIQASAYFTNSLLDALNIARLKAEYGDTFHVSVDAVIVTDNVTVTDLLNKTTWVGERVEIWKWDDSHGDDMSPLPDGWSVPVRK